MALEQILKIVVGFVAQRCSFALKLNSFLVFKHFLATNVYIVWFAIDKKKKKKKKKKERKYFTVPGPLLSPAVAVCGWCKLTSDLDPHTY